MKELQALSKVAVAKKTAVRVKELVFFTAEPL
jgi:hypothetical protein